MTTALPRPASPLPCAARSLCPPRRSAPFTVRAARPGDAAALAALSEPFVRSGALRDRPVHVYTSRWADFLVAQSPDGALDGCLALGVHPATSPGGPTAGVLYNFCVALDRQGTGTGSRLLDAALARARAQSIGALFTATTGSGRLFLRHGFAPVSATTAPRAWARSLDPSRNARVLARVP
ncbi:GNAT family N-acetyltransferase [Streptomyces sp. NPDC002996]